jgi:hypothetical protein
METKGIVSIRNNPYLKAINKNATTTTVASVVAHSRLANYNLYDMKWHMYSLIHEAKF